MVGGRQGGEDGRVMLDLLAAIETDPSTSQRRLSRDLGIALGLANAYLTRCVRKGLVKISTVPLNRYAYYLTADGFAEKSRLTAQYLSDSLDLFRRARSDYADLFAGAAARGLSRAVLVGGGDLAEIALLAASEADLRVVALVDRARAGQRWHGLPVVAEIGPPADGGACWALTDQRDPQGAFDAACAAASALGLPGDLVLAPALLRVSRARPAAEAAE